MLKKYKLAIVVGLGLVVFFVFMTLNNNTKLQQKPLLYRENFNKLLFQKGEKLYRGNCIACHSANMIDISTAPALGEVEKKRNPKWVYNYTKNSEKMRRQNDPIALEISKQGWGVMPSFSFLKDDEISNIYYYIAVRHQMTLDGIPVPLYFRFPESENKNAQWCIHIVKENQPILFARHTTKKQWFFGCKEKHASNEWKPTTLHQVFEKDTTVDDASFLPEGFYSKRSSKASEWESFKD